MDLENCRKKWGKRQDSSKLSRLIIIHNFRMNSLIPERIVHLIFVDGENSIISPHGSFLSSFLWFDSDATCCMKLFSVQISINFLTVFVLYF